MHLFYFFFKLNLLIFFILNLHGDDTSDFELETYFLNYYPKHHYFPLHFLVFIKFIVLIVKMCS